MKSKLHIHPLPFANSKLMWAGLGKCLEIRVDDFTLLESVGTLLLNIFRRNPEWQGIEIIAIYIDNEFFCQVLNTELARMSIDELFEADDPPWR